MQAVKQNRRGASLRGGFSASQQEEQGQKQGAGQDGEEDVHRPQAQGLAARAGDAAVEAPGLHGDGQLLRPAHRLDQQGLEQGGGEGKNPDTAGGKGGAGALVLLHHIGQDAPGGQQAVGEHRGEAELLLEGAHQEDAVGGEDKEQAQPGEGQYPAAQHQPVPHRRPGEGLGGGVDGHARPGVKVVAGGEHAHRHQKHGDKSPGQHLDVGAGEEQGGQTYRKYRQVDRRVMESGQQKGGHHQPDELTGGIERLHTGSPPSARRECRRSPEPVPGRGWTG